MALTQTSSSRDTATEPWSSLLSWAKLAIWCFLSASTIHIGPDDCCQKIQASIPPTTSLPPQPSVPGQLPSPSPAIQLTNLLGSAPSEHIQTLHSLYASQIATLVWLSEPSSAADLGRKSAVVGLALKKLESGEDGLSENEKAVFHEIMGLVQGMLKQYSGA